MTVTIDITKAELIALIGRALISAGRSEEATLFYRRASLARDVQEVRTCAPDDLPIEVTT